jgi:hypothetical protein
MAWAAVATVGAGVVSSLLAPDTSGNSAARDAALAKQAELAGKAGGVGDTLVGIAGNQQASYKTNFSPLEGQLGTIAQNAGGVDAQNKAAGLATASVAQSFGNAQGELDRNLARSGAAPGTGNAIAQQQDMAINKAKAESGAATMARQNEFDRGTALKASTLQQAQGMNGVGTYGAAAGAFNGAATGLGSVATGNQNVIDAGNKQSAGMAAGLGSVAAAFMK